MEKVTGSSPVLPTILLSGRIYLLLRVLPLRQLIFWQVAAAHCQKISALAPRVYPLLCVRSTVRVSPTAKKGWAIQDSKLLLRIDKNWMK